MGFLSTQISLSCRAKFSTSFLIVLYRHLMAMQYHSDHLSRRYLCVATSRFPRESIGESHDSMTTVPVIVLVCDLLVPQSNPTPSSTHQCCRTHFRFLCVNRSREIKWEVNPLLERPIILSVNEVKFSTYLPSRHRLPRLHCLMLRLFVCLYLLEPSTG